MKKILITGGLGYIGSHTIVDLVERGYEVFSIDDGSRSHEWILENIKKITNVPIRNYKVNLCDFKSLREVFQLEEGIEGIIHFAAYKSVSESIENPTLYFENNIVGMINILKCTLQYKIENFVFSSSCTVYAGSDEVCVTEETLISEPKSPYARTKIICEQILKDTAMLNGINVISLRYFNPVGAHESALIGEIPIGTPHNLVPYITQTAIGRRERLFIYGNDYPTRDGTCIRDYLHVSDLAHAHVLSLDRLFERKSEKWEVFNLGLGRGVTVKEMVDAFIRVTKKNFAYAYTKRREGDITSIYSDNTKARKILNWNPQYSLQAMIQTAWKWECELEKLNSR